MITVKTKVDGKGSDVKANDCDKDWSSWRWKKEEKQKYYEMDSRYL